MSSLRLISLVFFICLQVVYAQDLKITSKHEQIRVVEDSSYVNSITVNFKEEEFDQVYPLFYDTELEEISDIRLYHKKGKRLKELPTSTIKEENINLDYITSKKIKYIRIPGEKEVVLKYKVACKELMYLSSLHFFSYDDIDSLNYNITVPNKFKFIHNTVYKDLLKYFKLDSTQTGNVSKWTINVVPQKIQPNPLQFFGIYKNLKVPLMRTIVVPVSYSNRAKAYINDWYYESIAHTKLLSPSVTQKIDALTRGVTDPLEITTILYDYIRNNFKYVAIEIGMGAFIPTPINEVFTNKQGDCKDLSNLLSEALKYKGIDSHIALASTFDHLMDCDFPSLSSANHVICVANINGQRILLDPTDPTHEEGTPVMSLQNRTILVIDSNEGNFVKVEAFSPKENEMFYQVDLKMENSTDMSGSFEVSYKGNSRNLFKYLELNSTAQEFKKAQLQYYRDAFGISSIKNLAFENTSEVTRFKGNISIIGKTFEDKLNKYLFIDYLPKLIETEQREEMMEGIFLRNPFHKKVRMNIKLDKPIKPFQPIKHEFEEDGVNLNLDIVFKSENELEINYDFVFPYIFIEKYNVDKVNAVLKSYKKIINEPIVLSKALQ